MPPNKQQIAWGSVAAGLIATVLGAIVINFVILPIRENAKARTALSKTVDELAFEVRSLKEWQAEMQKWKERQIAATGRIGRRTSLDSLR